MAANTSSSEHVSGEVTKEPTPPPPVGAEVETENVKPDDGKKETDDGTSTEMPPLPKELSSPEATEEKKIVTTPEGAKSATPSATSSPLSPVNGEEDDYSAIYKQHEWPLKDIKEPHENDVLYGRGGGTNHNPGNKRYRKLVDERKVEYVNSKRLEKPQVAMSIIRSWRKEQVPPGRFLKLNEKSGLWDDVGDKKAREKTSQALREKAPIVMKQLKEQEQEQHYAPPPPHLYYPSQDPLHVDEDESYTPIQTQFKGRTRFADGTKSPAPNGNIAKPAFGQRVHSLGTETPDDRALEKFSWDEASKESLFEEASPVVRETSFPQEHLTPMQQSMEESAFERQTSVGSIGSAFAPVIPHRSTGGPPPAPVVDPWGEEPPYARGPHSPVHESYGGPYRDPKRPEEYSPYPTSRDGPDPMFSPHHHHHPHHHGPPPPHRYGPPSGGRAYFREPRSPAPYPEDYPYDRPSPYAHAPPPHAHYPPVPSSPHPDPYYPKSSRQSSEQSSSYSFFGPGEPPEFHNGSTAPIQRQGSNIEQEFRDVRRATPSMEYSPQHQPSYHRASPSFDSAHGRGYVHASSRRTQTPLSYSINEAAKRQHASRSLNRTHSADSPHALTSQRFEIGSSPDAPSAFTVRRGKRSPVPSVTSAVTPRSDVVRPVIKRDTSHQAEKPDVKKDTKMRRSRLSNDDHGVSALGPHMAEISIGKQILPRPNPLKPFDKSTTMERLSDEVLGGVDDLDDDWLANAPPFEEAV